MKTPTIGLALALTFASGVALAQTSTASAPVTRAEVKAEARAAEKAGTIPSGEQTYVRPSKSVKSRAEVKAATAEAGRKGELPQPGLVPEWKQAKARDARPSTTTRAERKATTQAAAKAGQLPATGEAQNAPEVQKK